MRIENPDEMVRILEEMGLPNRLIKERIVGLKNRIYEVPSNSNCAGTAFFVVGRLNRPIHVKPDREEVVPYLEEAEIFEDRPSRRQCGDVIICFGNPKSDFSDFLEHAVVYLGKHGGEDLVFHRPNAHYCEYYMESLRESMGMHSGSLIACRFSDTSSGAEYLPEEEVAVFLYPGVWRSARILETAGPYCRILTSRDNGSTYKMLVRPATISRDTSLC